jgi:hypothetical protein
VSSKDANVWKLTVGLAGLAGFLWGAAFTTWLFNQERPEVVFIEPGYAIAQPLHNPAPPCNRCHDPVK